MTYLIIGGARSGISASLYIKKRYPESKIIILENNSIQQEYKKTLYDNNIIIKEHFKDSDIDNDKDIDLNSIEALIPSPGVSLENIIIQKCISHNIPIVSELNLALKNYKGSLISVTGTNGKSTISAMIYHILKKIEPNTLLGGNFGIPPTELFLDESIKQKTKYLVLEVSSYQSETSKLNSDVAVFSSFSSDHLTRHKTMLNYFNIKYKLFADLKNDGLFILTDSVLNFMKENNIKLCSNKKIVLVSKNDLMDFSSFNFKTFDRINAQIACETVSFLTKKDKLELAHYLADFKTLEHRCEYVGTYKDTGVKIINDSKSTNCESLISALENIDHNCILLIGGRSKKEDFKRILDFKDKIKLIIFFGEDANLLKENIISNHSLKTDYRVYPFLKDILKENIIDDLINQYHPDTLLFSPACASFDEFKNFEHRGTFFKEFFTLFKK